MPSRVDTQTHTHIPMHKPKQFQEIRHMWPKAVHALFKNSLTYAEVIFFKFTECKCIYLNKFINYCLVNDCSCVHIVDLCMPTQIFSWLMNYVNDLFVDRYVGIISILVLLIFNKWTCIKELYKTSCNAQEAITHASVIKLDDRKNFQF